MSRRRRGTLVLRARLRNNFTVFGSTGTLARRPAANSGVAGGTYCADKDGWLIIDGDRKICRPAATCGKNTGAPCSIAHVSTQQWIEHGRLCFLPSFAVHAFTIPARQEWKNRTSRHLCAACSFSDGMAHG
ncbi:hypothetical protein BRADI_2g23839v3 [Brachypodium distachyon]|uniref:Uncharacterized protein n=1 Tax=Brachypodium distachyon TaxID=15368 RepID=A0A2K2DA61_BRADI|nr:hypothetical protein BRADI_2g23839v3 [Brachypodium distachyon]